MKDMDLKPPDQPYPLKNAFNIYVTKEKVYFLGAGASVFAGIPTIESFRDKAIEIHNSYALPGNRKEIFYSVLKDWGRKKFAKNIEEYYSSIEISNVLSVRNVITPNDIMIVIRDTIQKSFTSNQNNTNKYRFYKTFLDHIMSENNGIITTNWDIVLESLSMMFHNRLPPNILKLHGALNCGFCDGCGKIYFLEKEISEETECPIHKKTFTLVVVPPGIYKAPFWLELWQLWRSALDWLQTCKKVYFIGYSFRENDIAINALISTALGKNEDLKVEDIKIVDKKDDVELREDFMKRCKSIIPKPISESNFYWDGFKKFCEEMLTK